MGVPYWLFHLAVVVVAVTVGHYVHVTEQLWTQGALAAFATMICLKGLRCRD